MGCVCSIRKTTDARNMYFSRHSKSIHPDRLRPREWKRMVTEVRFNVFDDDLDTRPLVKPDASRV